jgi:hypothetical protein
MNVKVEGKPPTVVLHAFFGPLLHIGKALTTLEGGSEPVNAFLKFLPQVCSKDPTRWESTRVTIRNKK